MDQRERLERLQALLQGIPTPPLGTTVPGFTVVCNECGSVDVYVHNNLRYHPECGPWGEVELACGECLRRCKIADCE